MARTVGSWWIGVLGGLAAIAGAPAGAPAQVNPPATQCVTQALAGGSADAITTAMLPCVPTTTLLVLLLTQTNATTTPTLQPVGTVPQVIVRADGTSVAAGELAAGTTIELVNDGVHWKKLTGASSGAGITSITAVSPIDASPNPIITSGTLSHGDSGVTPGSYSLANIVVNEFGHVTAASNGSALTSLSQVAPIVLTPNPITSTGTIGVANATSSTFGVVKPDNTTITISGGVISSTNGGTVTSITATSPIVVTPSPLTSTGVVSLDPLARTSALTTETLSSSDCNKTIYYTSNSAVTVTIPASMVPADGHECYINIAQFGTAKVSVNGSAVTAATLRSDLSFTGTSGLQYSVIGLTLSTVATVATAVLTGAGS